MTNKQKSFFPILLTLLLSLTNKSFAEDVSLLPKYGDKIKTAQQLAYDKQFIQEMNALYSGDKTKAAFALADKGWQSLRQGDLKIAMKRFNQAWLVDPKNGHALWGMATISNINGNLKQSLELFNEAKQYLKNDLNFSVDHAKATGLTGINYNDNKLIGEALNSFAEIYKQDPQNTNNLQNWAIVLFYQQNFKEAWDKIKLAELTPNKQLLDPNFIQDLSQKMPRP